jgi:hypothetical protein
MKELKQIINGLFEMRDLGPINYLLGVKMKRGDDGSLELDQTHYIEGVLERYGMTECRPVATPLDVSQPLTKSTCPKTDDERREMEKYPYLQLVGSIMYLASATRPDIAYAASRLGRFSSNPGLSHWQAAKRVLRYLKGTKDRRLVLKKNCLPLTAYVDADWAADSDDRKSQTGYVLELGGSPVMWRSVKQTCISTSTMEAEYVALAACTKEIQWVRRLLQELGLDKHLSGPTVVHCDNQSAICCARDTVPKSSSRHIDIRYHVTREAIQNEQIMLKYVPTEEHKADILTKPLPRARHELLTSGLRLESAH